MAYINSPFNGAVSGKCEMKKEIHIRKNKAERYCLRACLLSIIVFAAFSTGYQHQYSLLLIWLPLILAFTLLSFYIESWKIIFSSDCISKKCFFLTRSTHSYAQILDAYQSYSSSNHEYVTLIFIDKKHSFFRLKDENANKALKLLSSHRSVRHLW